MIVRGAQSTEIEREGRQPTRAGVASTIGTASTIGAAARAAGVSAKMIRHYEAIGLLRPAARSAGNYRTYDAAAIRTLRLIGGARTLGFSMAEIKRLLALWRDETRASAAVRALALGHIAELDRRVAALQAMKQALGALAERCRGDDQPECAILDDLSGAPPRRAERR